MEPRVGNQARHDPGIDGWNDRVVVASQDQGWLTELMQPGQAGPAHACQQLPVIPETVRRSNQVCIRTSEVGPLAEHAAIEGRGNAGQVRWLQVPTRTQQFGEDTGPTRNRDRAHRGRRATGGTCQYHSLPPPAGGGSPGNRPDYTERTCGYGTGSVHLAALSHDRAGAILAEVALLSSTLPTVECPLCHRKRYMLTSSQARSRQFRFQRTQVAILLTQVGQVACPGLSLVKLLVQGAHFCEKRACVLVVLAASLGNQSFSPLPVQLDGFTWVRLFGGPGDLKGDVAEAVIPIALVVGVAVAIFLRHPFHPVRSRSRAWCSWSFRLAPGTRAVPVEASASDRDVWQDRAVPGSASEKAAWGMTFRLPPIRRRGCPCPGSIVGAIPAGVELVSP